MDLNLVVTLNVKIEATKRLTIDEIYVATLCRKKREEIQLKNTEPYIKKTLEQHNVCQGQKLPKITK